MGRFYHFTSRIHLPWILESGFLKQTDSILDANRVDAAPGCVWLLDTPDLGGYDHGLGGGLAFKSEVRFTVDVPDDEAVIWVEWAQANGIDGRWFEVMTNVGGGLEAAEHWRSVFRPVVRDEWVAVDVTVPDGWEPLPDELWRVPIL